jgi:hypothetical protein
MYLMSYTERLQLNRYAVIVYIMCCGSRDSTISIATGYGLEAERFDSRQWQEIFLYTASRPALRPTKSHAMNTGGTFSLGLKQSECEADTTI